MRVTVNVDGIHLTYEPSPDTDLSKLDIVSVENEDDESFRVGNTTIKYKSNPVDKNFKSTNIFDGSVEPPVTRKGRDKNDVEIRSDEPVQGIHTLQENFWYNEDGEIMPDDELYRFNTEYVQLCRRKFDCYAPNYINKSGLGSNNIIVDMSGNDGLFDESYGEVTDNSTGRELVKLSVIDIAKYIFEGVPISTHNMNDAFIILTIVNDSLDKYVGTIPVAPTTFIAPEEWFEPLLYLRESIMETRPGLIKKLTTNLDHTGKPRKPRLTRIQK